MQVRLQVHLGSRPLFIRRSAPINSSAEFSATEEGDFGTMTMVEEKSVEGMALELTPLGWVVPQECPMVMSIMESQD